MLVGFLFVWLVVVFDLREMPFQRDFILCCVIQLWFCYLLLLNPKFKMLFYVTCSGFLLDALPTVLPSYSVWSLAILKAMKALPSEKRKLIIEQEIARNKEPTIFIADFGI